MRFTRERHVFSRKIQEELHQLRELDNWHGPLAVLYDYTVIVFAMLMFHLSMWLTPISILLIGSRQRALATLLHESVHCCLTKSRALNRFLGTYLSGYLIFQEFNTYRDTHVRQHHAYLGDPEHDPDFHYHINEKLYHYHGCFNFFKHYILKPLILQKTLSYFLYLIKYRMLPSKKYLKSFLTMFIYWGGIICVCSYFNAIPYLMIWIFSLTTSAAIIGWFNELAEHYPLVKKHQVDLYMTRNRFSHCIEHFLFNTHAENYHLVHHLQVAIPFWNLSRAHEVLCQDPDYKRLNETMGGIFISKNKAPSLIKKLLSEPAISHNGLVQYE